MVAATNSGTIDSIPESLKGCLVYYAQCMYRNRRYLLAYSSHRLHRIRELLWETGPVIPADLREYLSDRENEYFTAYTDIMNSYCSEVGLQLASDLEVNFIMSLWRAIVILVSVSAS